ncbi:MAG TPA: NAD(P)/FAD-dependent oxidoreductase [Solirubrobacteraceae bacterium]
MSRVDHDLPPRHRVVIVGGGFGGLSCARSLRRAHVDVTLVDRRNFHLFQPLLYQVATGSLSPGEIATPLRAILKRQRNTEVVMAEVVGFDLAQRQVLLGRKADRSEGGALTYDTLVVAAGARHSFFGHDEWEFLAPGMKTVEHALRIRRRMLLAFEAAELEEDPEVRRAWLNFVIVGAGATGVELAGQFAEIARHTLKKDFRRIDPREACVMLVEGTDRVLPPYVPKLSAKAQKALDRLGVRTKTGALVVDMDAEGVTLKHADGRTETIAARTKIWAAGVEASPLGKALAEASGAPLDRAGRVTVEPDLSLPGHREVFVIGDLNRVSDGEGGVQPWPGVAQPAIQQGKYVARMIKALEHGGRLSRPFRYRDKGDLATIGRRAAVADVRGIRFAGLAAWLTWLFVHIAFLVGLQNRVVVFLRWTISFLTYGRSQRLITGDSVVNDFEQLGSDLAIKHRDA